MYVTKKMAVMSGDNGVSGVVKVEKLDKSVSGNVCVYGPLSGDCYLGIRINSLPVQKIKLEGAKQSFRLTSIDEELKTVECAVVDVFALKVLMKGCNCGKVNGYGILSEFETRDNVVDYAEARRDDIAAVAEVVEEPTETAVNGEDGAEEPVPAISPAIDELTAETPEVETEALRTERTEGEAGYDGEHPFSKAIGLQMEDLFTRYEHDAELEELVADSRWVRVYYEDDSYYVVGEIYADGKVEFICYGYPAERVGQPPEDIKGDCSYLPLDREDPEGRGYYVIYQDGNTGEVVRES